MAENPDSEDFADDDPTDELPVLSEATLAERGIEVPTLADAVSTQTGELTARLVPPDVPLRADATPEESEGGNAAQDDSPTAPELDIAALTARWGELEARLEENATTIATLGEQLGAQQRALDRSNAAQRALIAQLRDRDDGGPEDRNKLEALRMELARKDERIDHLQAALQHSEPAGETAEASDDGTQLPELTRQLADANTRLVELEQASETLDQARKALETELAARQDELAAAHQTQTEQASRIEALRQELETERKVRRKAATERPGGPDVEAYRAEIASLSAYIENRRREWDDLHATLAEHKTRIMELERELAQRTERQIQLESTVLEETDRATALRAELATLKIQLADQAAELTEKRRAAATQMRTESGDEDPRALELDARERQLETQRQSLDAREQALAEAQAALEQRLAALDDRTLSQELGDSKLQVDVHSESITALQRELTERIDALRAIQDDELSGDVVDLGARRGAGEAVPGEPRFTLVCLTSERPISYPIKKGGMIVGRGSESDIQILTHFVSREHARLELDGDHVDIEDLRSTNGVFVNAVRIEDRQRLQHGDWVTIGETQFRFLDGESA